MTAGAITSINITNGGSGYSSANTVSISGGNDNFSGYLSVNSDGTITAININSGGSGYTESSSITINTGSGFSGSLDVKDGVVSSVTINNRGSGYTSPSLSVTSGSGLGLNLISC